MIQLELVGELRAAEIKVRIFVREMYVIGPNHTWPNQEKQRIVRLVLNALVLGSGYNIQRGEMLRRDNNIKRNIAIGML